MMKTNAKFIAYMLLVSAMEPATAQAPALLAHSSRRAVSAAPDTAEDAVLHRPVVVSRDMVRGLISTIYGTLPDKPQETGDTISNGVSRDLPQLLTSRETMTSSWIEGEGAKRLLRRIVSGVLFSSALFLGLLWHFRSRTVKSATDSRSRPLELVDSIVLAPRCSLHLVRVSDQLIVVGRDATGMGEIVPIPRSFGSQWSEVLVDQQDAFPEPNESTRKPNSWGEPKWQT